MSYRQKRIRRLVRCCAKVLVRIWLYGPLSLADLEDDLGWTSGYILGLCGQLRRAGYLVCSSRRVRGMRGRKARATHWGATANLDALLSRGSP